LTPLKASLILDAVRTTLSLVSSTVAAVDAQPETLSVEQRAVFTVTVIGDVVVVVV
jgi:hypothetical protein